MRSRSVCSDMARQKGLEKRRKKRLQSVFPKISIIEDEETENLAKFGNTNLIVNILDTDVERSSSTALLCNRGITTLQMLEEAEEEEES